MTATDELKPCRRCGRQPELVMDYWNHELVYAVICQGCTGKTGGTPWYRGKSEAVNAWNRSMS